MAQGLTPEMAAAVCKLMPNQDLILAARKCRVVTAFRDTLGLPGQFSMVSSTGRGMQRGE
jgi:ethanolamine ammonia-lyase large subunit